MTFVLATLALAASALAGAAALRLRGVVSFALAAYFVAWAELVLLTEALSPSRLVGTGGYLVGQAVLLVSAVAVWNLRGRPRPSLRRVDVRARPIVIGLAVVVALGLVYAAFIPLATPPNNADAMSFRAYGDAAEAWLKGPAKEPTPSAEPARLTCPPNVRLLIRCQTPQQLRVDASTARFREHS